MCVVSVPNFKHPHAEPTQIKSDCIEWTSLNLLNGHPFPDHKQPHTHTRTHTHTHRGTVSPLWQRNLLRYTRVPCVCICLHLSSINFDRLKGQLLTHTHTHTQAHLHTHTHTYTPTHTHLHGTQQPAWEGRGGGQLRGSCK